MITTFEYSSPVGGIRLVGRDDSLIGLQFMPHAASSADSAGDSIRGTTPVLLRTGEWLDSYFAGECPDASELPLAPDGNGFRRTVWEILLEIPYGCTVSYGDVAREVSRRLGRGRMSAQAVGGAVGHNPIPIIIPCHRVIGADGRLVGYSGGLEIKTQLLMHEGVHIEAGRLTCSPGVRGKD